MRTGQTISWRNRVAFVVASLLCGAPAFAADSSMLTQDEIKKLVESGHYKDAQGPIYRALALQGPAAAGYDRCELFLLRAECQLQSKDQVAAIASLEQAKKEATATRQFNKLAQPTAMALLLQKSSNNKYIPKNGPKEGLPILDPTERRAAYAALLTDELPAAKAKVDALSNAKTMGPVLEAAKAVGIVHSLELVAAPDAKPAAPLTTPLASRITTQADRMLSAAIDDYNKQTATISNNAQEVIHDTVPMYDPMTKKSWLQPRVRRRGPSDQEVGTLRGIMTNCDKIHASAAELAATLVSDLDAYQAIANKADAAKAKAAAVLMDDYSQVP